MSTGSEFVPYADDSKVLNLGQLSIENGTDCILLSGSMEFPSDPSSLPRIEKLIDVLTAMREAIKSQEQI